MDRSGVLSAVLQVQLPIALHGASFKAIVGNIWSSKKFQQVIQSHLVNFYWSLLHSKLECRGILSFLGWLEQLLQTEFHLRRLVPQHQVHILSALHIKQAYHRVRWQVPSHPEMAHHERLLSPFQWWRTR
jgi:hypothetical protein